MAARRILIIESGFGGLGLAITLKRAGIESFTMRARWKNDRAFVRGFVRRGLALTEFDLAPAAVAMLAANGPTTRAGFRRVLEQEATRLAGDSPGASLARSEAEVMLEAVAGRWPRLAPVAGSAGTNAGRFAASIVSK